MALQHSNEDKNILGNYFYFMFLKYLSYIQTEFYEILEGDLLATSVQSVNQQRCKYGITSWVELFDYDEMWYR